MQGWVKPEEQLPKKAQDDLIRAEFHVYLGWGVESIAEYTTCGCQIACYRKKCMLFSVAGDRGEVVKILLGLPTTTTAMCCLK